ncbi:glycoside hydrolase family 127 protein [Nonomuraea rhodomycinica]|uniref:Glycoside hydrolase family 127 protein n=1 Tax=Nonomuraea rhodomycinica TaxID=1712872 RepID=A0A7Y6MFE0_9ACTN|nr:beta-L-arabinofuranosidase domain-containing protein [Nonomuraea rhodomycinica]NUW44930.1 glycoside hydrolase family 127 protein [Nonomuraea rhodomycinica]
MTITPQAPAAARAVPVLPSRGPVRPLGLGQVTLTGGFWGGRQSVNAAATLAHCESWMERLGWLANFDRVADGTTSPDRPGWSFSDSEVYKLLEALAWEEGRTGDQGAEAAIKRLTARVARAQDPDGYLNTCFGHDRQQPRYSDLEMGHELYNTGHLLQAAVARLRTAGEDDLVGVARRAADHVCRTFGADGLSGICGHPEIEVGLAEFGRATGEDRYVEQARLFLERRGHGTLRDIPLGRAYFQDDVPIRRAEVWRGHAVRALYLTAAAVDVAVERGDDELLRAVERQWERSVERRTYITGGMGSRHQDEGFGEDWELPPDRAYCETCAGIASIMVSWRLHLATGDVRYTDLIERTLYNVVAASPSPDGRAFFYANPLHQRSPGRPADPDEVSPRAEGGTRAAWFEVSCCPTNVARTLAGLAGYLATTDDDGLQIHQYAPCAIRAELPDGRPVAVDVETDYPASGAVRVRVAAGASSPWTLSLRVPAWAAGATVTEDGRTRSAEPGVLAVRRAFQAGDVVLLDLPMRPRFTWPDPRIDAVRGCVAVERGPEVLCAESRDLPDPGGLDALVIDAGSGPEPDGGGARVRGRIPAHLGRGWAYAPARPAPPAEDGERFDVPLRPYHSWAHRGPTSMRVWLPVEGTS